MGEHVERETAEMEREQSSVKPAIVEKQAAEKKRVRQAALAKRDALTKMQRQEYSDKIVKNVISLPCYRDADAVLTYISFRSEVDTFPLLAQAFADGKAVFAPKVLGKEIAFYRIFSVNDLASGYMGILEPVGGLSFETWNDDQMSQHYGSRQEILICMPGAAFDRTCHRIGYGGGFYDRYLSRILRQTENTDASAYTQTGADMEEHPQLKFSTAALAYDCQIYEEIPWETHDICPMCVVTEQEIWSGF